MDSTSTTSTNTHTSPSPAPAPPNFSAHPHMGHYPRLISRKRRIDDLLVDRAQLTGSQETSVPNLRDAPKRHPCDDRKAGLDKLEKVRQMHLQGAPVKLRDYQCTKSPFDVVPFRISELTDQRAPTADPRRTMVPPPPAANIRAPQTHRFVYVNEDNFVNPRPPPPVMGTLLSRSWGSRAPSPSLSASIPPPLPPSPLPRRTSPSSTNGDPLLSTMTPLERREFVEAQSRSLQDAVADRSPPLCRAHPRINFSKLPASPPGYTRSMRTPASVASSTNAFVCTACSIPLVPRSQRWFMRRCGHVYCHACAATPDLRSCQAPHCIDHVKNATEVSTDPPADQPTDSSVELFREVFI